MVDAAVQWNRSHRGWSPCYQLLAAVDVVRGARQRGVGHDVHGEGGDVGRSDDAPDWQRRAKLIATPLKVLPEERCRQRRVHEAGGDHVDADRCQFEREVCDQRGHRRGNRRDDSEDGARAAAAGAAHEQQRAAGPHLAGRALGYVDRQQHVLGEAAARLLGIHFEQGPVVRAAGRDHHMVDRCWQVLEEPLERSRVVGVEGRGALRAELLRCLLEALGIAAGEDYIGTLSPGASSCLEPYACAAADDDDSLSDELRFAPGETRGGCGGHDSSDGWWRRPITALPRALARSVLIPHRQIRVNRRDMFPVKPTVADELPYSALH